MAKMSVLFAHVVQMVVFVAMGRALGTYNA